MSHKNTITCRWRTGIPAFLFLGILVITGTVSGGVTVSFGSTVPLSGYASGTNTVYLFLTGPNLPSNGVALDNVNQRADEGYFTQVDVISGRWSYSWNTQNLGSQLDAGTYTIWVVDGPADRSHLSGYDYSTIPVTFGTPSVSIGTPSVGAVSVGVAATSTQDPNGSLFIRSDPSRSGVFLAGEYAGMTPLEIGNLTPGVYPLTIAKYGYANSSMEVKVVAGERSTAEVTLEPLSGGEILVNTDPAGATVSVDGVPSGVSPAGIANLSLGNHTIAATLEGYQPVEAQVMLEPGDTKTVNLTFPTPTVTRKSGSYGAAVPVSALVCLVALLAIARKRSP